MKTKTARRNYYRIKKQERYKFPKQQKEKLADMAVNNPRQFWTKINNSIKDATLKQTH